MEPVGLTLGAVALVSLFSSCIELIEYFELSKSYEYDYEKACIKLRLLQSRLRKWGASSQLGKCDECNTDNVAFCHWREYTPDDSVIDSSLRGIYEILSNAELLQSKYSLFPRKPTSNILGSFRIKARSKASADPAGTKQFTRPTLKRRSTTWAVRDKRRFDALISDLDFFISNLEKVVPQERPRAIAISMTAPSQAETKPSAQRDYSSGATRWSVDSVTKTAVLIQGSVDGGKVPDSKANFRVGIVTDNATVAQGGVSKSAFKDVLNRATSQIPESDQPSKVDRKDSMMDGVDSA